MSTERKPDEVRARAASESAWVVEQEAVARKFGVDPPAIVKEALGRLRNLAQAVLDATPGLGAGFDAQERVAELTRMLREEQEQTLCARDEARSYLKRIRDITDEVLFGEKGSADGSGNRDRGQLRWMVQGNARSDGGGVHPVGGSSTQSGTSGAHPDERAKAGGLGSGDSGGRGVAEAAHSKEGPKPIDPAALPGGSGARGPFDGKLTHGLVLVNAETGERRLFNETARDQYQVQVVAPDGLTAGEPWSTMPSGWKSPPWMVYWGEIGAKPALPRYDEPGKVKAKVQLSIEGAGATQTATPAPADKTLVSTTDNRKRIGDFDLAPDKAKEYADSMSVTEETMLGFFRTWKATNADKSVPNPGLAFWHAARREFKSE